MKYEIKPKAIRGTAYLCAHCGEPLTSAAKYCSRCKTVEGRAGVDEENREINKLVK